MDQEKETMMDAAKQAAEDAVYGHKEKMERIKKQLGRQFLETKDSAGKVIKEIDEYAKGHVWTVVGMAAAVGFISGIIIGKKKE